MAVTIRDVAKLAGTSASAVSATLNGRNGTIRVSAATRERIYAAAAQLGYVSNPIARSLATGKSKVIGLMLPYADAFVDQNPFCTQAMNGVLGEVVQRQYNVMLYTAAHGMSMEDLASTVDSSLAGLVLVMPPDSPPLFERLDYLRVPYVSILRDRSHDWVVNCDDVQGGYLAARHLIDLGHRQIGHLRGTDEVSTTSGRELGFRRALQEAGIDLNPQLMVIGGFDWRNGMAAMERLLDLPTKLRPTAVFCANDLCAEGAIRAARGKGLTVPDDVAIVGFDDTWFASMVRPALTTVRMPIKEMGQTAARMLMDRIEGEVVENTRPVLPVSLTVRHSCGFVSAMSHDETTAFRSHIQ